MYELNESELASVAGGNGPKKIQLNDLQNLALLKVHGKKNETQATQANANNGGQVDIYQIIEKYFD